MLKQILDALGVSGEINLGQIILTVTFIVTQTKMFIKRSGQVVANNAVNEMRLQLVEKNTELHKKELEKLELKIDQSNHAVNNIRMSMTLVKSKLQIPLSEKEQGHE